ncbi:MAG: hypothetical protein RLZZ118_257 [Bacteroidota bacterium]|jgi:gliding motility-associated-like protein
MKKLLLLFTVCLIVGLSQQAKASHAAGGELTYEWLSGSTYRFTLKFYRDCTGISEPTNFNMCYYNTCNQTYYNQTLVKTTTLPNGSPNGTPVPTGCPNPTACQNSTSTIPGFEEWWYQGDVTLASQCTEWAFWISESARNTQYNIGGGQLYIFTTLNNLLAQGNSSPNFSFKPVPYICVNQVWTYNNGAYDVNGDSLSYASVVPYTGASSAGTGTGSCTNNYPPGNVSANVGFPAYNAATSPFPSLFFGINSSTGIIQSLPNQVSQNVITVEVSEWRNGVKIGTILRDIQIAIVNCIVPVPTASIPSGSLGGLNLNPTTNYYDACIGDTANFCVYITGPIDTALILSSNNAALTLPGSSTTITGTGTDSVIICTSWPITANDIGYHVVTYQYQDSNCLYNPISVINSMSATIYVIPFTAGFGDTSICAGASAPLSAVGGTVFNWSVLPGGSPLSSLSCTNCANPIATPSVTTSYVVTSNLTSACSDNIDTVTVTVADTIDVNVGPDVTLCAGGNYQMIATVTPAIGNYAYSWSPATNLSAANILNPAATNMQNTTNYVLTVIPNGVAACAIKDTMRINVLQGFDIKNNDTTVCEGESVFIVTTGSSAYNYSWTPTTNVSNPNIQNPVITPDTLTTYVLTASYPGCQDSVQSITLDIEKIPYVNAGVDRLICQWDTAHLSSSVTPIVADPFYTFKWSVDSNLSNANISDPYFDGLVTQAYTVTVTTPKGCKGTDKVIVQVIPGGFLTSVGDQNYCPGDTVSLKGSGVNVANFYWTPGEFLSDSTAATTLAYPISTTIYTLYASDVNGCKDTITTQVFVASNGTINCGPDVTIFPGDDADLFAQGNCSNWSWAPITALSATNIINPIAQPSVTTQYVVNGTTEFGCTATDTIVVNVIPQSVIKIANAFSPGNGSSVNDQFKVQHLGNATLNYFRIYDRWGVMVFESTDINKGWNGRYNDVPQPIGTYVYQVDAQDNTGKHFIKTGNVSLIR